MDKTDNFDTEILSYFEPLNKQVKELQRRVAALEGDLAAHEQRELLRVKGDQYCRVCYQGQVRTGAPPAPPISAAEQLYHEANHAIGAVPNPSIGLSGFSPTVSWADVEQQAGAVRKARGG